MWYILDIHKRQIGGVDIEETDRGDSMSAFGRAVDNVVRRRDDAERYQLRQSISDHRCHDAVNGKEYCCNDNVDHRRANDPECHYAVVSNQLCSAGRRRNNY